MKSKWLISVGLIVCLVAAFALPMCAPAPPAEEEEAPPVEEEEELASSVNLYIAAASPDIAADMAKYIKEKSGVEIRQQFLSCGELGAKMKAEAPRFSADYAMHVCGPEAFMAKDNGWCVPYDSPAWRGAGEWKDPDNALFKLANWSAIPIGNKELLAEKGYTMPESWDDFLDPKWEGQIVMPSAVSSGNGYQLLHAFMTIYGFNKGLTGEAAEEAGWEYMKALDKNMHHYTRSGSTPADLVGRGEFILGMTQDAAAQKRIKAGYPLVYTIPEEGIGWGGAYAFIFKGTEKLYTCQKIIDLLGTPEYGKFVAGLGYSTKDAPSEFYEEIPKYVPNIDEPWAIKNKSRLLDEWKDRIGRVAE